jgi:hypothetical protein
VLFRNFALFGCLFENRLQLSRGVPKLDTSLINNNIISQKIFHFSLHICDCAPYLYGILPIKLVQTLMFLTFTRECHNPITTGHSEGSLTFTQSLLVSTSVVLYLASPLPPLISYFIIYSIFLPIPMPYTVTFL